MTPSSSRTKHELLNEPFTPNFDLLPPISESGEKPLFGEMPHCDHPCMAPSWSRTKTKYGLRKAFAKALVRDLQNNITPPPSTQSSTSDTKNVLFPFDSSETALPTLLPSTNVPHSTGVKIEPSRTLPELIKTKHELEKALLGTKIHAPQSRTPSPEHIKPRRVHFNESSCEKASVQDFNNQSCTSSTPGEEEALFEASTDSKDLSADSEAIVSSIDTRSGSDPLWIEQSRQRRHLLRHHAHAFDFDAVEAILKKIRHHEIEMLPVQAYSSTDAVCDGRILGRILVESLGDASFFLQNRAKKLRVLKLLCNEMKAHVNEADACGYTALLYATQAGDYAVTKLLLDAHANVNASDVGGIRPLMHASSKGDSDLTKLLLGAPDVDVNAVDMHGTTACSFATTRGDLAIVKLLYRASAQVNTSDAHGISPLMAATHVGNDAMVDLLLHGKANPDTTDADGISVLAWASKLGHARCAKYLVCAHANVNATSGVTTTNVEEKGECGGYTALHYATMNAVAHGGAGGCRAASSSSLSSSRTPPAEKIMRLLLKAQADVEVVDSQGHTCLHYASSASPPSSISLEAMRLLTRPREKVWKRGMKPPQKKPCFAFADGCFIMLTKKILKNHKNHVKNDDNAMR